MSKVDCPYCGKAAVFVDSAEVYHGKGYGMIYLCRPCQAWVGSHKSHGRPLGTPAKAKLRKARMNAHRAFDVLWKGTGERKRWYAWLALQMGLTREECHIGSMTEGQCARVIELSDRRQ